MRYINSIFAFLLLCCQAFADRPLPVVSTWNTGENQTADDDTAGLKGFTPDWQYARLMEGRPLLPAFELFWYDATYASKHGYYEPLLGYCAANHLPISIVGQNFSDAFKNRQGWPWSIANYASIPESDHPWVVVKNADGTTSINRVTSPWGSVAPWYQLGWLFGQYLTANFCAAYPDPPAVYVLDDGEVGMSGIGDNYAIALTDYRTPPDLAKAETVIATDTTLTKLGAAPGRFLCEHYAVLGYRVRVGQLKKGMDDALPAGWKGKVVFLKYGVWGNEFRRVNNLWLNQHPFGSGSQGHDGIACNVGYLQDFSAAMPWFPRCPQFEACNSVWSHGRFQREHRPDFDCEALFWNGKAVVSECWQGVVKQVLWTMRRPTARFFSGSSASAASSASDYTAVADHVQAIRNNAILSRFWQRGILLENRWKRTDLDLNKFDTATGFGHPYDGSCNNSYLENHWYQQNVPVNGRVTIVTLANGQKLHQDNFRLAATFHVKVNAICLQDGDEYLVVASATEADQSAVEIQVCPDGPMPRFSVELDVPMVGACYLRHSDGTIDRVN